MNPHNRLSSAHAAFTRPELIAITCILLIVATLGAFSLSESRYNQQRRACVDNLKKIGLAFRIASTDGGADDFPFQHSVEDGGTREYTNVWQHFLAVTNEISEPNIFICPTASKTPAASWRSFTDQNISYFLGVTAMETRPQAFLSGDVGFFVDGQPPQSNPISLSTNGNIRYLHRIHRSVGNICFGDGSVRSLSSARLNEALHNADMATNRLFLPR
ncbi:MAG TPA: hypothetical protein VI282_11390 [Verrucomicrobiae bacterium]